MDKIIMMAIMVMQPYSDFIPGMNSKFIPNSPVKNVNGMKKTEIIVNNRMISLVWLDSILKYIDNNWAVFSDMFLNRT